MSEGSEPDCFGDVKKTEKGCQLRASPPLS